MKTLMEWLQVFCCLITLTMTAVCVVKAVSYTRNAGAGYAESIENVG